MISCSSAWTSSSIWPPSGATCSGTSRGARWSFAGSWGAAGGRERLILRASRPLFAHFPGLYVATPASAADAKGLLVSALRGTGPVILLENRALYELQEEVPEEPVPIPFGKGKIVRSGTDVTIVGASLMAYEAKRAAEILADHGVDAEVIDPRSIRPFDEAMLLESIKKTGRLVVADTSWAFCGFSAEVAAIAAEKGWEYLKAPVRRVTPADCPAPVSRPLEEAFHPSPLTIAQTCLDLLKTDSSIKRGVSDVQESFAGPY